MEHIYWSLIVIIIGAWMFRTGREYERRERNRADGWTPVGEYKNVPLTGEFGKVEGPLKEFGAGEMDRPEYVAAQEQINRELNNLIDSQPINPGRNNLTTKEISDWFIQRDHKIMEIIRPYIKEDAGRLSLFVKSYEISPDPSLGKEIAAILERAGITLVQLPDQSKEGWRFLKLAIMHKGIKIAEV